MLFLIKRGDMVPAQSHSFSTRTEADTLFIQSLKINERKQGRANFSWVVIQALKDYAKKVEKQTTLEPREGHY